MLSVAERFWTKVRFTADCWLWTGASTGRGGAYGSFANGRKRDVQAHRWAYEFCIGPILKGLQIDHLCRTRLCVNPDHLDVVTSQENTLRGEGPAGRNARKTHCTNGHPFDSENTAQVRGGRRCRTCQREHVRRRRRRISMEATA